MEVNYFKNRKEVEQFFKNEMFEFSFSTGSTIYYETLEPIFLGNGLFKFQLGFYTPEEGCDDFFKFSSFNKWLDKFQLSSVEKISQENLSHEQLFSESFDANFKRIR